MKIILHKNFKKRYKKLRSSEKQRFKVRRNIFLTNPWHPLLNNHALSGKYTGCRSINVGGDLRVVYTQIGSNISYFIAIDTHSNLYK